MLNYSSRASQSHPTVILGGGFAGLFTALHLSQQNYSHPIILIEQRDRFSFKPLLYELLSGENTCATCAERIIPGSLNG
ncbi:NAD(P)-binding protein [Nostoc linckia]|uniref:NAD(P)-binding protein n=1 Tax=Nostoc linckia TaxID=92942 RepID=UPI0036F2B11A